MLSAFQQTLLRSAVRPSTLDGRVQTTDNSTLEDAIAKVRAMAPDAFHDKRSLATRRFYHEPRPGTPHASHVVPFPLGAVLPKKRPAAIYKEIKA